MSKFHTLQILRGVAASIVVADHAYLRQLEWSNAPGAFVPLAEFAGAQAVAIFFVISGYIMIAKTDGQFGQPGAASDFLLKRIMRIVPLYWTATLLEITLRYHKGGVVDPWAVPASLFFVPISVSPGEYMRPLLGVGWTLDYEMFFYLIFAGALLFARRLGLAVLFSTLLALVALGAVFKPLADTGPPHTLFTYWSDPLLLLFALGAFLGLLPANGRWQGRVKHPIAVTGGLLALCTLVFMAGRSGFPLPIGWQFAAWGVCAVIAAACIFGRQSQGSGLAGVASHLGDISYSLYLFHFFAVVAVEKVWWLAFGRQPSLLFILAAYVGSVAAAYAIHHVIELNFARIGRRDPAARHAHSRS